MYLYRKIQQWSKQDEKPVITIGATDKSQTAKLVKELVTPYKPYLTPDIAVNIAYWRKANAIHNWFVQHCADGIDDCTPMHVSLEQLKALDQTLQEILQAPNEKLQRHIIEAKLPPVEGFFFGDTNLDDPEWLAVYLDDVAETHRILTKEFELNKAVDQTASSLSLAYQYQASW